MSKQLELDLFMGVYPCGIVYADRGREAHGDYLKVAFLPYDTLQLKFYENVSDAMKALIESDAASMQARKGEIFATDTCRSHTVLLGSKMPPSDGKDH